MHRHCNTVPSTRLHTCLLVIKTEQIVDMPEFAIEPESSSSGADASGTTAATTRGPGRFPSRLSFFIDGAHTPESMVTVADWFAQVATPVATATAGGWAMDTTVALADNCMVACTVLDPSLFLHA